MTNTSPLPGIFYPIKIQLYCWVTGSRPPPFTWFSVPASVPVVVCLPLRMFFFFFNSTRHHCQFIMPCYDPFSLPSVLWTSLMSGEGKRGGERGRDFTWRRHFSGLETQQGNSRDALPQRTEIWVDILIPSSSVCPLPTTEQWRKPFITSARWAL